MRLVVLGANGRTGKLVVREALKDGAQVTAVVRSAAKSPGIRHRRMSVVIGDPADAAFLTRVFEGQDAVISALGGRSPTKRATAIYWTSAAAIAEAAPAAGVKMIAVTSSALLFPSRRFSDRLLKAAARSVVKSAVRMEKILNDADLNVAAARCGFLTNAAHAGYRAEIGALPERPSSVSRQSLARFLVDTAGKSWSGYRVYGVASPSA